MSMAMQGQRLRSILSNFLSVSVIFLLFAMLPTDRLLSQEGMVNAQQQARLIEAMKQLEKMSRVTSGRGKFRFENRFSNPKREELLRLYEIAVLGGSHIKSLEQSVEKSAVTGVETLRVMNPDYCFVLTRANGGPYSIMDVQKYGRSELDDREIAIRKAEASTIFWAYVFYGRPVWELLRHPDCKLLSIESSLTTTGQEMVRVDFEFAPQEKKFLAVDFGIKDGYIVFSPDDGWKMVRYCRGYCHGQDPNTPTDPRVTKATAEDSPSDQLAFCKLGVIECPAAKPPNEGENHLICTQSSYTPVPKEEFYLSHYGFPEPNFGSKRYWLWMLGGLIGGIACIVASRRLLKR
ncbi:MAG: hypothetical protein KF752_15905 [Pirellulaceae bacterium]|nr:hypothetical protein [Pirellulaceae bacterium]